MADRIGELLVARGLLTPEQVDLIVAEQKRSGRPFGDLAERMFDLPAEAIEAAWVEQFSQLTERVDPCGDPPEGEALELISRRQAWQFRLLPWRMDDGQLIAVTTEEFLPRAVRFAGWQLRMPVYFMLASESSLEEALRRHYPLPGIELVGVGESLLQRAMGV